MNSCELCGKPASTRARIEGVALSVCANCMRLGTELKTPAPAGRALRPVVRRLPAEKMLVTDFARKIREARQRKNLTPEDAAKLLNIRQSTLLHFEAGKMQPDDAAAKKLEKFYQITLYVEE